MEGTGEREGKRKGKGRAVEGGVPHSFNPTLTIVQDLGLIDELLQITWGTRSSTGRTIRLVRRRCVPRCCRCFDLTRQASPLSSSSPS